jgi:hypothetical protein
LQQAGTTDFGSDGRIAHEHARSGMPTENEATRSA